MRLHPVRRPGFQDRPHPQARLQEGGLARARFRPQEWPGKTKAQPDPVRRLGYKPTVRTDPVRKLGFKRQAWTDPVRRLGFKAKARPDPVRRPGFKRQASPGPVRKLGFKRQAWTDPVRKGFQETGVDRPVRRRG